MTCHLELIVQGMPYFDSESACVRDCNTQEFEHLSIYHFVIYCQVVGTFMNLSPLIYVTIKVSLPKITKQRNENYKIDYLLRCPFLFFANHHYHTISTILFSKQFRPFPTPCNFVVDKTTRLNFQ